MTTYPLSTARELLTGVLGRKTAAKTLFDARFHGLPDFRDATLSPTMIAAM